VVPTKAATKSEWIMPYDDIRAVLDTMKTFYLVDCECRVEKQMLGHSCKFPTRVCLRFSPIQETPVPYNISKQEALAVLDKAEEIGLVHTVSNWSNGYSFVCNCCGCCCKLLRGLTKWGVENSVAQANYYAVHDPDLCLGCGTCIERCQVNAISEVEGVSVVDRKRCIGCGLCVTGCPNGVARLERKPEAEVIVPSMDFPAWEHRRLHAP
jgi:Na+-translocating ferredoxin:NAD+ oxidoreductase RNF subunit RnfB